MHTAYHGICAYLAVHFERIIGGASVDHFVAKSPNPDQAYEWRNYRLACTRLNTRKGTQDMLDPFEVQDDWFHLELVSGRIFPNPTLPGHLQSSIQQTIERLKLDDAGSREIRSRHFQEFTAGDFTGAYLSRRSPFVWREAVRQGLIEPPEPMPVD